MSPVRHLHCSQISAVQTQAHKARGTVVGSHLRLLPSLLVQCNTAPASKLHHRGIMLHDIQLASGLIITPLTAMCNSSV